MGPRSRRGGRDLGSRPGPSAASNLMETFSLLPPYFHHWGSSPGFHQVWHEFSRNRTTITRVISAWFPWNSAPPPILVQVCLPPLALSSLFASFPDGEISEDRQSLGPVIDAQETLTESISLYLVPFKACNFLFVCTSYGARPSNRHPGASIKKTGSWYGGECRRKQSGDGGLVACF